jgi:hypothetical protein
MRGNRPIDFAHYAEECRRLTNTVEDIEDKSILLIMAQVWIRLADREQAIAAVLEEDRA